MLEARQAAGQFRVIRQHGAHAHQDRIALRAEQVDAGLCLRPGDGGALAHATGDLVIGGKCQFQNHLGTFPRDPGEEARHVPPRFICHQAGFESNPGAFKNGVAAARDARVRVLDGGNDTGDPCPHQRLRTGAGPAMMRAGLQRHIGSGAACGFARHVQGFRFGVGPAAGLRPPDTQKAAVLDDHAADIGVFRRGAQRPAAKPERMVHPAGVVSCHRSRRCPHRPKARPEAPRSPWPRGNSCRRRRSAHRPRRPAS
jgi:hypothetical protein